MSGLAEVRGRLSSNLADTLRAIGDTAAARREKWAAAYDYARMSGDNITTVRSEADRAVVHLDAEIERLKGEAEALRVEINHIDFQERR